MSEPDDLPPSLPPPFPRQLAPTSSSSADACASSVARAPRAANAPMLCLH